MAVSQSNARRTAASHASGGTQGAETDFSEEFKREITQAIQPTLDEFRQRMAQAISSEMATMPRPGATPTDSGQTAEQPAAPEADAEQDKGAQEPDSTLQRALQEAFIPVRNTRQAAERSFGALPSTAQAAGRSIGQGLQALLVAGLAALLTETSHAAVQQRAEQGLRALTQKAFEAAPPDFANQEIREKTEQTLQLILREALDAVYAEGVRASLQQDGQQTIQQALNGDFSGAVAKIETTLQLLMTALVAALRRHQQTILRLLIAFALLAVVYSLEHSAEHTAEHSGAAG